MGNTCVSCKLQLALCGQDPETALNSALASVNFYLQQQQLYFEFREAQLQKKINKVQEACKKKLQEVHTGYTAVSINSPHCMLIRVSASIDHIQFLCIHCHYCFSCGCSLCTAYHLVMVFSTVSLFNSRPHLGCSFEQQLQLQGCALKICVGQ